MPALKKRVSRIEKNYVSIQLADLVQKIAYRQAVGMKVIPSRGVGTQAEVEVQKYHVTELMAKLFVIVVGVGFVVEVGVHISLVFVSGMGIRGGGSWRARIA